MRLAGILALGLLCGVSFKAMAYDKPYIGDMGSVVAKKEDTLVHMARDYDLGFVELRAANPGMDPWIPGAGTKVTLPTRHLLPDAPHKGLVINLAEMRLYAFLNGDGAPSSFPLAIGREGLETPLGNTTVERKVEGPIWRPTKRMLADDPTLPESVGQGPENPMGTHAMYLGWREYAIHGTNKPYGIGRRASSGCIRMYPEDIIALYDMTGVGEQVTVVNQPIKLAWIDGRLYLEAHPDIEQAIQIEETGSISLQRLSEQDMQTIIKAAGGHADRLRWPVIRQAVRERRGYPIEIAATPDAPKVAKSEEASQPPVDKALAAKTEAVSVSPAVAAPTPVVKPKLSVKKKAAIQPDKQAAKDAPSQEEKPQVPVRKFRKSQMAAQNSTTRTLNP